MYFFLRFIHKWITNGKGWKKNVIIFAKININHIFKGNKAKAGAIPLQILFSFLFALRSMEYSINNFCRKKKYVCRYTHLRSSFFLFVQILHKIYWMRHFAIYPEAIWLTEVTFARNIFGNKIEKQIRVQNNII